MIENTLNILYSIRDISYYIMTTGDNETKYSLISSLNKFNHKIENMYFNMLSKKIKSYTYNSILNYAIYIAIIHRVTTETA